MRRYHRSPSIPFHIARVECLQEPVRASVDGLNASGATSVAQDRQTASQTAKNALRVFLWSLWVSGVAVGAGLALELNGMMHHGLFAQAFGFFVAVVSVLRHPEE